jgi:hypothetical protein
MTRRQNVEAVQIPTYIYSTAFGRKFKALNMDYGTNTLHGSYCTNYFVYLYLLYIIIISYLGIILTGYLTILFVCLCIISSLQS